MMNDLPIWATLFLAFGMFALGHYAGELSLVRRDRRINHLRSEVPGASWLAMGMVSLFIAGMLAIISAFPVEKMVDNASRIRSQVATEEALK
jgi:hypothetical protein